MTPFLALGTAQFGLNYGITNTTGQVDQTSISDILDYAHSNSVVFLDTAQAYGDAETILGKLSSLARSFKIISKISPLNSVNSYDSSVINHLQVSLETTFSNLNVSCLDCLLLHSPSDFNKLNSSLLLDWLFSLQDKGCVRRIGVSIYSSEDLHYLPLEHIQVIQLPSSIYDQRLLLDGTVDLLRNKSISLHARSLYLQGLIVTPSSQWPSFISPSFRSHHSSFERFVHNHGHTLVQMAASWARQQSWLESAVFGVTSLAELNDLCTSWNSNDFWEGLNSLNWAWSNPADLDPRLWS